MILCFLFLLVQRGEGYGTIGFLLNFFEDSFTHFVFCMYKFFTEVYCLMDLYFTKPTKNILASDIFSR